MGINDDFTSVKKHEEDLQRLKNLRLLDDDFMEKIFEDSIECTELLLNIILDREDLKVKEVRTQYSIKNLQGRSVRLDIFATDIHEKKYNCEIQRADRGAGAKRARYNSSLIDANITSPGDKYNQLPESYVIFITENDVLGKDLPIYSIERMIQQTGELFGDGSHILYVNGAYRGDNPIGKLMADFSCTNPDNMQYEILANRVKYFKEDKEGIKAMCKMMEDMRKQESIETAIDVYREVGLDNETIVEKLIARYNLTKEEALHFVYGSKSA
jgi:hypothetical protein